MPFAAQHIRSARLHLQKSDPVMKQIIKQVGPFTARTQSDRFLSLVRAIVSQQISTAAAQTIFGRLEESLKPANISPESIVLQTADSLRESGISRMKSSYLLDLAEKVHSGAIELRSIGRLSDEEVIERLTQIKGIGRWTAQMFLMFCLGRMDVLPVDDLGIQNAIKSTYQLDDHPTKSAIEDIASAWRPYATVACWYLWQSQEKDA